MIKNTILLSSFFSILFATTIDIVSFNNNFKTNKFILLDSEIINKDYTTCLDGSTNCKSLCTFKEQWNSGTYSIKNPWDASLPNINIDLSTNNSGVVMDTSSAKTDSKVYDLLTHSSDFYPSSANVATDVQEVCSLYLKESSLTQNFDKIFDFLIPTTTNASVNFKMKNISDSINPNAQVPKIKNIIINSKATYAFTDSLTDSYDPTFFQGEGYLDELINGEKISILKDIKSSSSDFLKRYNSFWKNPVKGTAGITQQPLITASSKIADYCKDSIQNASSISMPNIVAMLFKELNKFDSQVKKEVLGIVSNFKSTLIAATSDEALIAYTFKFLSNVLANPICEVRSYLNANSIISQTADPAEINAAFLNLPSLAACYTEGATPDVASKTEGETSTGCTGLIISGTCIGISGLPSGLSIGMGGKTEIKNIANTSAECLAQKKELQNILVKKCKETEPEAIMDWLISSLSGHRLKLANQVFELKKCNEDELFQAQKYKNAFKNCKNKIDKDGNPIPCAFGDSFISKANKVFLDIDNFNDTLSKTLHGKSSSDVFDDTEVQANLINKSSEKSISDLVSGIYFYDKKRNTYIKNVVLPSSLNNGSKKSIILLTAWPEYILLTSKSIIEDFNEYLLSKNIVEKLFSEKETISNLELDDFQSRMISDNAKFLVYSNSLFENVIKKVNIQLTEFNNRALFKLSPRIENLISSFSETGKNKEELYTKYQQIISEIEDNKINLNDFPSKRLELMNLILKWRLLGHGYGHTYTGNETILNISNNSFTFNNLTVKEDLNNLTLDLNTFNHSKKQIRTLNSLDTGNFFAINEYTSKYFEKFIKFKPSKGSK